MINWHEEFSSRGGAADIAVNNLQLDALGAYLKGIGDYDEAYIRNTASIAAARGVFSISGIYLG